MMKDRKDKGSVVYFAGREKRDNSDVLLSCPHGLSWHMKPTTTAAAAATSVTVHAISTVEGAIVFCKISINLKTFVACYIMSHTFGVSPSDS